MFRSIIPIILIITSILIGFFYAKPIYEEMSIARSRLQAIDETLQKTKDISSAATELRREIESISPEDLDKLENVILPDDIDQIRFLNMLSSVASRQNLFLEGLQITNSAGDSTDNTLIDGRVVSAKVNKLEVSFSVSTDYDTFKIFLNDLEQSLALIEVEDISISVPSYESSEEEGNGDVPYAYSVQISTYWIE